MSKLGNVKRGRMSAALRYLFYGVEGVGKSTLAAHAPEPIYLDLEDGTSLLDCARYPFRAAPGGHVAETYEEIVGALDDLREAEHDFKSVVIDTIDRLEPLLWEFVCRRDSESSKKTYESIEDYGYGKGYQVALDEWRALGHKLDVLRTRKGMNIIMVGHAQVRTFKNPEGDDYDRYSLRVHDKAAGFLREWCDVLGFATFEGGAAKAAGDSRARGYATGRRLVHLERSAAFDAKSRIPLPGAIELAGDAPWRPIGEVAELGADATPELLTDRILDELKRLDDSALTAKVGEAMNKAHASNDTRTLVRILNKLRRK